MAFFSRSEIANAEAVIASFPKMTEAEKIAVRAAVATCGDCARDLHFIPNKQLRKLVKLGFLSPMGGTYFVVGYLDGPAAKLARALYVVDNKNRRTL